MSREKEKHIVIKRNQDCAKWITFNGNDAILMIFIIFERRKEGKFEVLNLS